MFAFGIDMVWYWVETASIVQCLQRRMKATDISDADDALHLLLCCGRNLYLHWVRYMGNRSTPATHQTTLCTTTGKWERKKKFEENPDNNNNNGYFKRWCRYGCFDFVHCVLCCVCCLVVSFHFIIVSIIIFGGRGTYQSERTANRREKTKGTKGDRERKNKQFFPRHFLLFRVGQFVFEFTMRICHTHTNSNRRTQRRDEENETVAQIKVSALNTT